MSRMHRNEYHREELAVLEGRVPVKRRWTEAEISEMAYNEARMLARDEPINMNQELQEIMQGRSLESIKGKRRSKEYKEMVTKILEIVRFDVVEEVDEEVSVNEGTSIQSTSIEDRGTSLEEHEMIYNMDVTTVVYTSIETYLDILNKNNEYGVVTDDEINLIDKALLSFDTDKELAKELVNVYLTTIIDRSRDIGKKKKRFC